MTVPDTRSFSVALNGGALHVEQRGDAPILFVHGFGGDLQDWDLLWPLFDSAIRYDLRGFGQSPQSDSGSFSHVDDLLALLDAAQIEHVNLVGLSMGGAIATSFALDHSERVRKLSLVSPGLMGWEWSGEWRAAWRTIVIAARQGEMDRARALWWQHPLFRSVRESDAAPILKKSIARYVGVQWICDTQRAAMPDIDRLHRLACPALLLSGGQDVPDFRLIADLIEGAVPRVERVDYPSHGHALHLEAPKEIGARIRAFL